MAANYSTTGVPAQTGLGTSGVYAQPVGGVLNSIKPIGDNSDPSRLYGGLGQPMPDEYVSYQLNKDIDANGQYIQQARNAAVNQANSRGALNSSIAAGNAQGAAIQAAMPMAQADAGMLANLQKTNLTDLQSGANASMAATATMGAAALGANASMTNTAASLQEAMQAQREGLAYQGEQAGLNRDWTSQFAGQQEGYNMANQQQQFYNQSGLMGQQANLNYQSQAALLGQNYQQQLGYGQFQLGSNLLQGQQNFYSSAGLAAMNNPAIMGDPQAFGGYMQFISNPFSNTIDNIFSSLFGQIGG